MGKFWDKLLRRKGPNQKDLQMAEDSQTLHWYTNPLFIPNENTFVNPLYKEPGDSDEDSLFEPQTSGFAADQHSMQEPIGDLVKDLGIEDAEIVDLAPQEANALELMRDQLHQSKKGGMGGLLGIGNSDKFNVIDETLGRIVNRMGTALTGDRKADQQSFVDMFKDYGGLIRACDAYLARSAHTDAGKARQGMVAQIRSLAEADIAGVRLGMDQINSVPQAELAGASWKSIMSRSREVVIDLGHSLADSEKTGGQASEVFIIPGQDGKKSFFKKEENYVRRGNTVEEEKKLARQQAIVELPDKMKLSSAARDIIAKLGDPSKIPTLSKDLAALTPDESVQKELTAYKTAVNATGAKIGIMNDVLTGSDRLNIALDEARSANISRRNVATSRIAELLGVGGLVAKSQTARIVGGVDSQGKPIETVGNLMEGASGQEGGAFQEQVLRSALEAQQAKTGTTKGAEADYEKSGSLQRDMSSLQVLDELCGQTDRHAKNYFIKKDDAGKAVGVMGIDNDLSFGRSTLGSMSHGEGKNRDVVRGGRIYLPHMDRKLAESILALNETTARYALSDLITEEEINFFVGRLKAMQDAIRREMKDKGSRVFLENDSDWNDDTHEEFMARQYEIALEEEKKRRKAAGLSETDIDHQALNFGGNYYSEFNYGINDFRVKGRIAGEIQKKAAAH